jgi:hypothetical protein
MVARMGTLIPGSLLDDTDMKGSLRLFLVAADMAGDAQPHNTISSLSDTFRQS